jgi:hypothetical protein
MAIAIKLGSTTSGYYGLVGLTISGSNSQITEQILVVQGKF